MRLPLSIRRLLSLPLRNVPVTIRSGPNRGRRWSLPVSGRGIVHGTFETEKFEALATLVGRGETVWDVGAHYGYATLVGVGATGSTGSVVAFEPSAHNRWFLERHLRWNDAGVVTVYPFALADVDGTESFGGRMTSSIAQKLGGGSETVEVRRFSTVVGAVAPWPDVVKLDVEGAESRVLEGAREALEARPPGTLPSIMCAVHDPEEFERCTAAFRALGYRVFPSGPLDDYLRGGIAWLGDPDVLALDPSRTDLITRMRGTSLFRDATEV